MTFYRKFIVIWLIIVINPLTTRVVWAPQMILQPVFSIFPCTPLPSGICRTPGLSIPWCCLPTSSSVCLVFFIRSLSLARWFGQTWWTGNMIIPLQFACLYDLQEVSVWSNMTLKYKLQLSEGSWDKILHSKSRTQRFSKEEIFFSGGLSLEAIHQSSGSSFRDFFAKTTEES